MIDAGWIAGKGWAVVEQNAAWGAGIYACDPEQCYSPCIVAALIRSFMAYQYKRRTTNEAEVLAQNLFRSNAPQHLTGDELEEFRLSGLVSSGTPGREWERIVARPVSEKEFYEFEVYKPSATCPYVEKIYAVILVSRDPSTDRCYVQWRPEIEQYDGPWFR